MNNIKKIFYFIAKYIGLFQLSRKLGKNKLQILCYHGFSILDEHKFRPKLFMCPDLFSERMKFLKEKDYPILSLEEGVKRLKNGTLPANAVVITIDDGWTGVEIFAASILKKNGFPWTLYLTTYYVEKRAQVINMVLQYLFWKSDLDKVDMSSLDIKFRDERSVDPKKISETFLKTILSHAENLPDIEQRQLFVRKVGQLLNINVAELESIGLFYLIDERQVRNLVSDGVDLQLHTHRHTMGELTKDAFSKEIQDNLDVMMPFCMVEPKHFCYPSGQYSSEHFNWLDEMGIQTATTCNVGLNDRDANPLALSRFLDGENISQIEFEAEMSGFAELLRCMKSFVVS